MLPTTLELLKAGLKADPTLTPSDRARVLALVRADGASPTRLDSAKGAPQILRRAEVARRLSCSLRTVDKLPLKKVKFPGRTRAAGFLECDVNGLLS